MPGADAKAVAAIQHAANLAAEYFDSQRRAEPEAALVEIDKRESEVREQFKSGRLPPSVLTRPESANSRRRGRR